MTAFLRNPGPRASKVAEQPDPCKHHTERDDAPHEHRCEDIDEIAGLLGALNETACGQEHEHNEEERVREAEPGCLTGEPQQGKKVHRRENQGNNRRQTKPVADACLKRRHLCRKKGAEAHKTDDGSDDGVAPQQRQKFAAEATDKRIGHGQKQQENEAPHHAFRADVPPRDVQEVQGDERKRPDHPGNAGDADDQPEFPAVGGKVACHYGPPLRACSLTPLPSAAMARPAG